MDARIGELNGGKFYAYVNGYGADPVTGTLEQVEVALGLRFAKVARPEVKRTVYNVTMTFEHPSWSTVDGIRYSGIEATTKAAAVKAARKMAEADGHAVGGVGRYWFKAEAA